MDCSTPGLPVHHQLPEFTQTHVHWVSDAIQPSHPLLSPLLPPSIFPSSRVFSNELVLHIRWPKYWSFSFSISDLACMHALEKEMATHSSILAWRIPGMGEPGGLPSVGSHRVGHDWSDLACMHALEKEMATPFSILAWRIPGTEEPGGLLSMGLHRVEHNWSDLAAAW